jgi:hypothetical protein
LTAWRGSRRGFVRGAPRKDRNPEGAGDVVGGMNRSSTVARFDVIGSQPSERPAADPTATLGEQSDLVDCARSGPSQPTNKSTSVDGVLFSFFTAKAASFRGSAHVLARGRAVGGGDLRRFAAPRAFWREDEPWAAAIILACARAMQQQSATIHMLRGGLPLPAATEPGVPECCP